jgi:PKD repeat protein
MRHGQETRKATALRLAVALAVGATMLLGLVPLGGAAPTVVDVPGRIVLESWQVPNLPNDPNRCITVHFLEFPALPGAGAYSAVVLNHVLNQNQSFGAGPTFFPGDSHTVSVGAGNVHTFTAPAGSHRIVLGSDSSGSGCTTEPRFSLVSLTTVVDNPPPTAAFTWEADEADPLTVAFDASESTDDEGIASYDWDFGGDGTGSGQAPSHTFSAPGTYPVTLTVTDTEGATGSVTNDVEVSSPCEASAEAAASAAAESGIARFFVVVRNTAGAGVRNVRVEIVVACGDETTPVVTSEPTNRLGGVLVEVPYEGDPQFMVTPLPFARFTPPFELRPVAAGTIDVEFRTEEACFGEPVTVLGSEDADTISLNSNDVLSSFAGEDVITSGAGEQRFTVCGGDDPDTIDP